MNAEVPNIRCDASVTIHKSEGPPPVVSASMLCVGCEIYTREGRRIRPVNFSGPAETVAGQIANVRYDRCKAVPQNPDKGNRNT